MKIKFKKIYLDFIGKDIPTDPLFTNFACCERLIFVDNRCRCKVTIFNARKHALTLESGVETRLIEQLFLHKAVLLFLLEYGRDFCCEYNQHCSLPAYLVSSPHCLVCFVFCLF